MEKMNRKFKIMLLILAGLMLFAPQTKSKEEEYKFTEISFSLLSQFKTQEAFNDEIEKIKKEIQSGRPSNNKAYLFYYLAVIRVTQTRQIKQKGDIESFRQYLKLNDKYYEEALNYLNKALKLSPPKEIEIESYLLKLIIYKEQFDSDGVEVTLKELAQKLNEYSEKPEEKMNKINQIAKELRKAGLDEYALKLHAKFISIMNQEERESFLNNLKVEAKTELTKGNIAEAMLLYEQYLDLAKKYLPKEKLPEIYKEIADDYFNAGQYAPASKYYALIIKDYPKFSKIEDCQFNLAQSYSQLKKPDEAIEAYQKFLENFPHSKKKNRVIENLAKLYYIYSFRNPYFAIDNIKNLIEKYPEFDKIDVLQRYIADIYFNTGDYELAIGKYKNFLETYKDSPLVLYIKMRLKEAEKYLKPQIKKDKGGVR